MELKKFPTSAYSQDCELASDPNTDPEKLRSLATHSVQPIRAQVTSNPNTPTDVLFKLGIEFPERLLNNPVFSLLSLENLNFIADLPAQTQYSLCTVESYFPYVQNTVNQLPQNIQYGIAQAPDTNGSILELMATVNRYDVRGGVANNPNTPISLLEKLAQESDHSIRCAVAKNLNTPLSLLEKLARDRECAVVLVLLKRPKLPESVLTTIAHSPDIQVRWHLASYPHCPETLLAQLSEDPDSSVRWVLAAHPDLPESLLQKLAGDREPYVSDAAQKRLSTL